MFQAPRQCEQGWGTQASVCRVREGRRAKQGKEHLGKGWAAEARIPGFLQHPEAAESLEGKGQKIPGDLGAQDSAGVAKDLIHLVNQPREYMVLPASSDCLLRPGRQNTASASPHSGRWQVQYSAF